MKKISSHLLKDKLLIKLPCGTILTVFPPNALVYVSDGIICKCGMHFSFYTWTQCPMFSVSNLGACLPVTLRRSVGTHIYTCKPVCSGPEPYVGCLCIPSVANHYLGEAPFEYGCLNSEHTELGGPASTCEIEPLCNS